MTEKLIRDVLSQVHPDMKISPDAVKTIKSMVDPMLGYFSNEINVKKKNPKEVMCTVLSGDLVKHAYSEFMKTGPLTNLFTETQTPMRIIEYLTAEILEVSGNQARSVLIDTIITPYHVYRGVVDDDELYATFHKYIPIFPYFDPLTELDLKQEDEERLVLPKDAFDKYGFEMTDEYRTGLNNVMRCFVRLHILNNPYIIELKNTGKIEYSAEIIAETAGRKYQKDERLSPIKSVQDESGKTILSYSKGIQPKGKLTFKTLLYATLTNPFLSREYQVTLPDGRKFTKIRDTYVPDMPRYLLYCIKEPKFTRCDK